MPIRNIPVITKLHCEFAEQSFELGHVRRISVLDPTAPSHFPCHIIGTSEGLLCTHGSEFVAIPWKVLREIWEKANPKLIPTEAPKNVDIKPHIDAALSEAAKLPPTP